MIYPYSCINKAENNPLWWLDTVFQGEYLPSLKINYVAINKRFGKIATTIVLDRDESFL